MLLLELLSASDELLLWLRGDLLRLSRLLILLLRLLPLAFL